MLPTSLGRLVVAAVVLIAVVGCGSGRLATYPASGKVVFRNGQPLRGGTVEFRSVRSDAAGLNARAKISDQGTFTLSTYATDDGAVEGDHKAIVVPPLPTDPTADERKRVLSLIHPRFRDYNTSGYQFTVKRGEPNVFTLVVE